MNGNDRNRTVAGAILVLLGLAMFGMQFIRGFSNAIGLFLIGGLFVAGYFYRRAYGLLIPGGILLGLGLGSLGEGLLFGLDGVGAIGLGTGFLAIYLIDLTYRGKTHWWPLIPGGIFILLGIGDVFSDFGRLLGVAWPILLVLAGLVLLLGALRPSGGTHAGGTHAGTGELL